MISQSYLEEKNSKKLQMQSDLIIVGVGNVLFKDEGIGVYAARYLEENITTNPAIEIIDGATLGFQLMRYFQEYKKVVIIDTVSVEDAPGSIYRLPAEEMLGLGSYRQTAHEVEIVEMLEICSLLDKMAEVIIIGVVPEDIKSIEIGLTKSLIDCFENIITTVTKELEMGSYGVTREERVPLDEIINTITTNRNN